MSLSHSDNRLPPHLCRFSRTIRRTRSSSLPFLLFFNDTATTEIYTLSLHDALPICAGQHAAPDADARRQQPQGGAAPARREPDRSEEHTSELQSLTNLVCRLLLEKKKNTCSHTTETNNDNDEHCTTRHPDVASTAVC